MVEDISGDLMKIYMQNCIYSVIPIVKTYGYKKAVKEININISELY